MALNYCHRCTCAYALSLEKCPQCGNPTNSTVTEVAPEPKRRPRKAEPEPEPETPTDA